MRICYGWARKPLALSDVNYHPEQLMAKLGNTQVNTPLVWIPAWIHFENVFLRLNTKEEMELACKLACIYHNGEREWD
jgi:hypothetical protein